MKKIFVMLVALLMTSGVVMASMHTHPMPSFNVKLTMDGDLMTMWGDPGANVLLTKGNMVRVIVRGLEPDSYYSLHHGSDCIDLGKKTNRHGNLRSMKMEWDYSDLYEMRDVPMGGHIPTLKDGKAEDFELKTFKCSASTGEMVLKGVEHKKKVRVWIK